MLRNLFVALCILIAISVGNCEKEEKDLEAAPSGRFLDVGTWFGGKYPSYGHNSKPSYGYYPGYSQYPSGGYYPGGYGYYPGGNNYGTNYLGSGGYGGNGRYGGYSGYSGYGGNGGYGGYGGNGGIPSYNGYNNYDYYGNRNVGHGYYQGTNRWGLSSKYQTPSSVLGYRGYN